MATWSPLSILLWLVFVVCVVGLIRFARPRFRFGRADSALCPKCYYDLAQSIELKCPECGMEVPIVFRVYPYRFVRGPGIVFFVAMLSLVCMGVLPIERRYQQFIQWIPKSNELLVDKIAIYTPYYEPKSGQIAGGDSWYHSAKYDISFVTLENSMDQGVAKPLPMLVGVHSHLTDAWAAIALTADLEGVAIDAKTDLDDLPRERLPLDVLIEEIFGVLGPLEDSEEALEVRKYVVLNALKMNISQKMIIEAALINVRGRLRRSHPDATEGKNFEVHFTIPEGSLMTKFGLRTARTARWETSRWHMRLARAAWLLTWLGGSVILTVVVLRVRRRRLGPGVSA